ncbi:DUF2184 domain-containing protein [Periweissella cryptocerci]|uniref:DUF2184 domain-containing protein n=1 Tax=Periweissella cryptocerci TaxID=2506420 RepID=A0A4P6YWV9_9LACO|nr:encapsulin [Periweissella cryptocerci]QBO37273.1 DUF2184 domain-containing protein [Periweissella cryptocerci]
MAVNGILEARDLEAIDKVIYRAPEEELVARQLFNIKSDVPEYMETYGYNVMTRSGVAKIIADNTDDLPMIDADMTRYHQPIFTIGGGVKYSDRELSQARAMGMNLDAEKADTVRRAIAEKENKMAFIGDASVGLKGLTNAVGIKVEAAAATWAESTPEEIVEQIRVARSRITVIPGYSNAPLNLVIAANQYELLNKRYNQYEPKTILELIRGYGWFEEIKSLTDLLGVGTGGTNSFMVYENTSRTAELLIPRDITRHAEERRYPGVRVPFDSRIGGLIIRTPYAIIRVDGI